ncbi:class I SAM-dependent methyltransferase [Kiritimatiellota bacterium B12222]|nr:class I SAM-dependent methyltransferase [Kiritimatiellota bacterium B12222]
MIQRSITSAGEEHANFWNELADEYQTETRISITDFHYGPLLPGDTQLKLLPPDLSELTCLELGAGAGQNSIYLNKAGAHCTALDVSEKQLEHGRTLAARHIADVHFLHADIDELPPFEQNFDLIHSAYGIPFSSHPAALIQHCADLLKPGGQLLFSMGHPVYAGEWLELDEDQGIFMQSYFHPQPDVRESEDAAVQARAYPLSEVIAWIKEAGLHITDLREPAALPVDQMNEVEISMNVPYYSIAWAEQVKELSKFPVVAIFSAHKPLED